MKTKLPLFTFRVLVKTDQRYDTIVARCLETGNVATADNVSLVVEMIQELIGDETRYAIQHNNLSNLFASPAPLETWAEWLEAASELDELPRFSFEVNLRPWILEPQIVMIEVIAAEKEAAKAIGEGGKREDR